MTDDISEFQLGERPEIQAQVEAIAKGMNNGIPDDVDLELVISALWMLIGSAFGIMPREVRLSVFERYVVHARDNLVDGLNRATQ